MDELKKYIQLHRPELDTDEPGKMTWSNTAGGQKHGPKAKTRLLYMRWASAASVVFAICALAYFLPAKQDEQPMSSVHVMHRWDIRVSKFKKDTAPAIIAVEKKNVLTQRANVKKKKRRTATPAPVYGFEGIEASYATMVDMQRERLRMQPIYGENAAYFDLFKKEFAALNRDEEQVKQQVRQTGMQDTHLDELINIYQEKINVLKQLQFEINRINTRTKQADPDVNTRPPSYIKL